MFDKQRDFIKSEVRKSDVGLLQVVLPLLSEEETLTWFRGFCITLAEERSLDIAVRQTASFSTSDNVWVVQWKPTKKTQESYPNIIDNFGV